MKECHRKNTFEDLRSRFLQKYGQQICEKLGCILDKVMLTPTPLAPQVQRRFLKKCSSSQLWADGLPCNLCPAVHGTNAALFESIFARGLLIPGPFNDLRVLHGSVYGNGVYTTNLDHAATSQRYCSVPRMLVCGVLDAGAPAIAQYDWGRVIFESCCVAPLFEASSESWYCGAVRRRQGLLEQGRPLGLRWTCERAGGCCDGPACPRPPWLV